MNETHRIHGTSRGDGSSVALGFVLGAIVGAGIALLIAPGTGKETRHRISDARRRWRGAARDMAKDLKREAHSTLDAAREALERGGQPYEKPPTATTE